jgi:hypothetical protein
MRPQSRGGRVGRRVLAALPGHTKSFGRRCEVLKAPNGVLDSRVLSAVRVVAPKEQAAALQLCDPIHGGFAGI